MRRTRKAALSAALAALLAAPPVAAEDLKPALKALTELLALDGRPIPEIRPREPVQIRVSITSGLGGGPPAGLELFGWLRRVDDSDLPCGQSAEAFLRTGRLPNGTMFLNDPVIGVLTEDRAFNVTDPDFSLASANILGAGTLDSRVAALRGDPRGRRFLLVLPDTGQVRMIGAAGHDLGTIDGLEHPRDVSGAGNGAVIVLEGGGTLLHVAADGTRRRIAEGVDAIRPSGNADWLVALRRETGANGGRAVLIDTGKGMPSQEFAAPDLRDATILEEDGTPFGIALLTGAGIAIQYLDAPELVQLIPLPARVARLAAAPGGRVALAWSPRGGPAHVIDVARGRLVRSVKANSPISEVAFSQRSAFLMLASQTHVGALGLDAIARGEAADFREILIGSAAQAPRAGRQLLAPLWPLDGMLAVHAESYQGYRIMESSTMGDAPAMTATTLRGGIPRLVATLDRSFREGPEGVFQTVASLPGPGRFELVATTGLGALSFCTELPVALPQGPEAAPVGRLAIRPEGEAIRLALTDAGGHPRAGLVGRVTFSALTGSWRAHADLQTGPDGVSDLAFALPPLDAVLIRVDAGDEIFAPLLWERDP